MYTIYSVTHIFPTVVIVGDEWFKRDKRERDGQWEETPDIYTSLSLCHRPSEKEQRARSNRLISFVIFFTSDVRENKKNNLV